VITLIHAHPALTLFVWTIVAFGIAYVVGHSVISRPLRVWIAGPEVARCPVCGDTLEARFDGATCEGPADDHGVPVAAAKHTPTEMVLVTSVGWRFWLVSLLECPACLGWWLGFAAGLAFVLAGGPGHLGLLPLAGAFYTAGANFLLGRASGLMPDPNQK
jgi:hypothetical protein